MKKISICFLLLFFSFSCLYAQQRVIDSLENLLKTDKEDTNKVMHLIVLGHSVGLNSDYIFDSIYSCKALKLAQILNYKKGIARANQNMGVYYLFYKGDYTAALDRFEKTLKIYNGTNSEDEIYPLVDMAEVYYELRNHPKSLEYAEEALKLVRIIKPKDMSIEGNILNTIAANYDDEDNFPVAIEFYFKALQVFDTTEYKAAVAATLGNIGNVYQGMGEYDSALKYEFRSLEKTDTSNKGYIANTYVDIGVIYSKWGKYPQAIDNDLKSLKLFEEIGNKDGIAYATTNLGDYEYTIDTLKAFTYASTALKMSEEIGDKQLICTNSSNIGSIYVDKRDYKKAEKYLLQADTLGKSIKAFETLKNTELELAHLYAKMGQWEKSNHYLQEYADLKDTLFNQDKSKQVGRLEAKYNYDKQLALQQQEAANAKALADAENKRQKIFILLIAAIALSIALIAVLIYRSLKYARKEKLLVERQKSVMELKALRAQMNPHFIFNVINSIQHFILKNDSDAAQEHLSEFSKLIRKVLENSRHETISLAEEIKMLELYLQLETMRFASKFRYNISIKNTIDAENVSIPPLIVQPYVENAIWHGIMHLKDKQGEVSIEFEMINDNLKCVINDNGVGRKRAMELKKGTIHESMGLSITKERIQVTNILYQTKIDLKIIDKMDENAIAIGTTIELLIPVNFNLASRV